MKFGFRFHSPSLRGMLVVQILQWLFVFNRSNHCGAGARTLDVEAGARVKTLDAWSQSRCLKFEFRLHSSVCNREKLSPPK